MFTMKRLALVSATFLAVHAVTPAARADLEVVASIKPIHSLVAGVMKGDLAPRLLIGGSTSPHTYSLRPSDARTLGGADVIFWVGHNLESFLEKSIEAGDSVAIELMDASGVRTLAYRKGTTFEAHDHAAHGHGDEDHAAHADDDHENENALDPHIWLDPANAQAMVRAIAEALIAADPEHAPLYAANAQSLHARIETLSAELNDILSPVRKQPFFVFHDAYHYMEQRYGLAAAGSITLNPDVSPGAGRVRDIRNKIQTLGATCVFTEPQFSPKLVQVVTADTSANTGVLDPLGAALPAGPDLYFDLMRNMATAMRDCLSPAG
jgi:zinc transport system substrate-binding protein